MFVARTLALRLARFDLDVAEPAAPPAPAAAPTAIPAPIEAPPPPPVTDATAPTVRDRLKQLRQDPSALAAPASPDAPTEAPPGPARDADGRWRNADGTFATPTESAALDATATASTADPAAPVDPEAPADPERVVLTLPPRRDGEAGREIEVDPDLAEELQHLQNGFMRRQEFTRRMDGVQQRETELREFQAILQADPVGVLMEHMPPARQQQAAVALAARHFAVLQPIFQRWAADPNDLRATELDLRDAATQARTQVAEATAAARAEAADAAQAQAIRDAIADLVPAQVDPDTARDFHAAALQHLVTLLHGGQPVTADAVPTLLASRAARYFGGTPPTGAPAATSVPALLAVPDAPAAVTPSVAPAPVSPQRARAVVTARRLPQVQAQRAAAAAIAPQGAGAPPAGTEPPPTHNTVMERLGWLRGRLTRPA